MYDACMRLELDSEVYWRMSPQESYRWLIAKTPERRIGGLGKKDIDEMTANIRNNEGRYM